MLQFTEVCVYKEKRFTKSTMRKIG